MRKGLGLHLRRSPLFYATLDFVFTDGSLSSQITFTRASTARYFDSNGILQNAAIDVPRFDYDPATLQPRGLLMEDATINRLNFSQTFATSGGTQNNWVDSAKLSRVSTTRTSPDGTGNALEIAANGAADQTIISSAAIGSSVRRTFSVWLKRVTGTGDIQYTLDNGATWTTVAITTNWVRYAFASTVADQRVGIRIRSDGDAIQIWGAQLENSFFATSYVPTTNATASRSRDVAIVSSLSPWFNTTQGTLFAQASDLGLGDSSTRHTIADINANSTSNVIRFGKTTAGNNANQVYANVVASGSEQAYFAPSGTIAANTPYKFAMAYAANDIAASLNGGAVGTDTTATIPTVSQMNIGARSNGANVLNGHIARLAYFPRRLSNEQLQTLTSL